MVRELIELARCDVCGSDEEVEGFTVSRGGKPKDVDLCGEHKAPLVELYDLGTDRKAPKPRKAPASKHAVVAIEDWNPEQQQP